MKFPIPAPPDPATVAVPALPRVTGGLLLHRKMPRYQREAPSATNHAPFCFICGAELPPWRASCFTHDGRHGRGLPAPIILRSCQEEWDHLRMRGNPTLRTTTNSTKPPMKNQLPRWPKFRVKPIPERRSTKSAGSRGL